LSIFLNNNRYDTGQLESVMAVAGLQPWLLRIFPESGKDLSISIFPF